MGPIATWLLEQAQQESAERAANDDLVAALVLAVSHLDANDDGERMTNDLPKIHTSTERIERLENSHMRLTARVKVLERALEQMQGGK